MNRKGVGVLFIIGIIVSLVGSGFIADTVLKSTVGIGLLDVFNLFIDSFQTLESAPSLDEVQLNISESEFNRLVSDRANMTDLFSSIDVSVVNNNEEATSILSSVLGTDYKIFMFTVTNVENITFRVFEWSIQFNNGNITRFESGKTFDSYNVKFQIDHEVANQLFRGQVSPEQTTEWLKSNKLKINPITEVFRVINALPQIVQIIQSRTQE